ncbi:MAG: HlyD family efflux transporter periplasmic adaptor subunit [Flavobacteriales bacterium]|nr:HlyD family efflux transporter periplasmic adaptor subunit [Flavobacteriales bacterium]
MKNYLHSLKIKDLQNKNYNAYSQLYDFKKYKFISRFLVIILVVLFIILFLPWTQNIDSKGKLIALNPEQRPQNIQTIIPGKIQKWYVKEGDFVKKGDTLIYLSEIKEKYLDPELINRTKNQINSKLQTAKSYENKANALNKQSDAILKSQELKLKQAKNYIQQIKLKITSDSIDFQTAQNNFSIAERQLNRMEELYNQGLKSLKDLETKKVKFQESQAKVISSENKFYTSKSQLTNAYTDLATIQNEYNEKFQKTQSDKYSTLSSLYDTDASITKMQNEYKNLLIRNEMYYVIAPQDGYITQINYKGIGEVLKENDKILTIMPANYDLAVEMFVNPLDLPLVKKGNHVQLFFDGWPSIVFSGWPNASQGTFEGKITSIDQHADTNGKFRIIVAPPKDKQKQWPEALRVGGGARGFVLLGDVSVGYEIWRKLNGFPPNYYVEENNKTTDEKDK